MHVSKEFLSSVHPGREESIQVAMATPHIGAPPGSKWHPTGWGCGNRKSQGACRPGRLPSSNRTSPLASDAVPTFGNLARVNIDQQMGSSQRNKFDLGDVHQGYRVVQGGTGCPKATSDDSLRTQLTRPTTNESCSFSRESPHVFIPADLQRPPVDLQNNLKKQKNDLL